MASVSFVVTVAGNFPTLPEFQSSTSIPTPASERDGHRRRETEPEDLILGVSSMSAGKWIQSDANSAVLPYNMTARQTCILKTERMAYSSTH